jgi:hypothetical protein
MRQQVYIQQHFRRGNVQKSNRRWSNRFNPPTNHYNLVQSPPLTQVRLPPACLWSVTSTPYQPSAAAGA